MVFHLEGRATVGRKTQKICYSPLRLSLPLYSFLCHRTDGYLDRCPATERLSTEKAEGLFRSDTKLLFSSIHGGEFVPRGNVSWADRFVMGPPFSISVLVSIVLGMWP